MTSALRNPTRTTFDGWLSLEESSTVRHELIDGNQFALSTERLDRGEKKLNYLQIP